MKRIFKVLITLVIGLLSAVNISAQSPEKMSYQAVIRDSNDQLITNSSISLRLSIVQGSASGTEVYTENQTVTTNINGLLSTVIGEGTVISGSIDTIDWSAGPYYIKTEIDPEGGTNYTIYGAAQMLSVPYALYAKTTGSITETDPVFLATAAAGITDAGSGKVITEEERERWNNAIPDTIMHPENNIYTGGLTGAYQTYVTTTINGTSTTEFKQVLVFSVPGNEELKVQFAYLNSVVTSSGTTYSYDDPLTFVIYKTFNYNRKPYEKSYIIYVEEYTSDNTLQTSTYVSPEVPVSSISNSSGRNYKVKLVSESTISITMDRIGMPDNFYVKEDASVSYMANSYVNNFSGETAELHVAVKNQGSTKSSYLVLARDCSQTVNVVSSPSVILEAGEQKELTVDLEFPGITYTGNIYIWVDLVDFNGTLFDEVQVYFKRVEP